MILFQITTEKSISEFDSNEADTDKKNPFHGILTLTIQSKGVDSQTASTTRGPGRPPINDISLEDTTEIEDPVMKFIIFFFFRSSLIFYF